MGNGRWENGEWEMGNGKWGIGYKMEDVQEERGVKLRNGVKSTEHWYGRAHTDLAMIKNWTLTPSPSPPLYLTSVPI